MSSRLPALPRLGAHMSIAGGIDRAVVRGAHIGCETIQVFVKSNVQWRMTALRDGERDRFVAALRTTGIRPVFAHSSYLINLASADRAVRKRSVSSLAAELRRTAELGLPFLVVHPGSHGGSGEARGIRRIVSGLGEVFRVVPAGGVRILLETTAGQGNGMGYCFGHLAEIMAGSEYPDRLGVCLDTAHVFAAGYDIRTEEGYHAMMEEFDGTIGLDGLMAVHLNDSRAELGSRVDRHEHIGKGKLGEGAFRLVLNDARLARIPMVLETPKGRGMMMDRRNLSVLKSLRASS